MTNEPDYPQMERQHGLFLDDSRVYKCNECGRYAALPEDQARPNHCPYGCDH